MSTQTRELDSLSTEDLWQHLRTALSHFSRAYVVLDALDEMDPGPERDKFVCHLSELGSWKTSKIKILTTSRPVASLERSLRNERALHSKLDEASVDRDIDAYVQTRLETSTIPTELHNAIKLTIPGKAQGLFLYAKLAMDRLLEEGVDVSSALSEIPDDLRRMYVQLLTDHASKHRVDRKQQLLLMQWITHSVRPLRLIEMSDMLISNPLFSSQDLGAAKSFVRSACGSLLELLRDETLCVIHHSLTEFLKGDTRTTVEEYPILEPGPTNYQLALICLAYLQNGCLEAVQLEEQELHNARHPSREIPEPVLDPFTRYAASNWHLHVQRACAYGLDQKRLYSMLDSFTSHGHFLKWAYLVGLRSDLIGTPTILSMSISLGITGYLRHLLEQPGFDPNQGGSIVLAADKGFIDIVDLLLRKNADANQFDAEGYTALHRAAIKNHPVIVRLLLKAGGDMSKLTKIVPFDVGFGITQRSAIWYACHHGHEETAAEMQAHMISLKHIEEALIVAIKYKRTPIVRNLLEHPLVSARQTEQESDSNDLSGLWRSSEPYDSYDHSDRASLLSLACSNRDLDTIELLIAAGADVNDSALHALARSKEVTNPERTMRCFSLLIQAGADVNLLDQSFQGYAPLHQAADVIAVTMLLEAGACVDVENGSNETPLHTCTHPEVLYTLVTSGKANLEKEDQSGQTALLAQSSKSLGEGLLALLKLIDLGANVNAVDRDGNGVLHLAIETFSNVPDGLMSKLCTAGVDVNRTNKKGKAPIHLTRIKINELSCPRDLRSPERVSWFEALRAAGADLMPSTPSASRTPLFEWISKSIRDTNDRLYTGLLETLDACGVSLHVTDDRGRTLLHDAVRNSGSQSWINFLLSQGLDPKTTDRDGNTLYHEAAYTLSTSLYKVANEFTGSSTPQPHVGPDPRQSNHHGRTPLHILSSLWPDSQQKPGTGTRPREFNCTTAFDVALALYTDVDISDKDGISPIHLASTFSEYLVKRLISRRADLLSTTIEGCTALHLAARGRMPNIVGLLLETLRSRHTEDLESAVNHKDRYGRTPLYYACLAGSYESAKLLVQSGASVTSAAYESSPWRGVAHHESEDKIWSDHSSYKRAGAVLLANNNRSIGKAKSRVHWHRLDELIVILITTEASPSAFVHRAIVDAAVLNADRTVESLVRASNLSWSASTLTQEPASAAHVTKSLNMRLSARNGLDAPCVNCKISHNKSALSHIWIMQDYYLLPDMFLAQFGQHLPPKSNASKELLRDMISRGFAKGVSQILDTAGPESLNDLTWRDQPDTSQNRKVNGSNGLKEEPLLLGACRRNVSNIDVIRILVEKAGHDASVQQHFEDISERQYQSSWFQESRDGESTLHALIRGEHWWQMHEGLRYLLDKGANTELRDVHGKTPLSAALDRCGRLEFDKYAVDLLLQCGANVNAIDRLGNSCLAKACPDSEMTRLLLDHGAIVTQDVFIQSIRLKDANLLEFLLLRGADPNVRGTRRYSDNRACSGITWDEYYPLHYLLDVEIWSHGGVSEHEIRQRMVSLLLDHGALPCASYGGTTILHELVKKNKNIGLLFKTTKTNYDLETRNEFGETPLLTALQWKGSSGRTRQHDAEDRSAISLLISHGADVCAVDSQGNNILHLAAKNDRLRHDDLLEVLKKVPELVNEKNVEGSTPLHCAVESRWKSQTVELLLKHGADVQTVDGGGNSLLHFLLRGKLHRDERGKVYQRGSSRDLDYLLSQGLDINLRNKLGESPVFSFVRHGIAWLEGKITQSVGFREHPVFMLFTKAGVDWQICNEKGQSLLHVVSGAARMETSLYRNAATDDHLYEIFKTLVELGLDPGLEDQSGRTPVDVAADLGHCQILEMFRE